MYITPLFTEYPIMQPWICTSSFCWWSKYTYNYEEEIYLKYDCRQWSSWCQSWLTQHCPANVCSNLKSVFDWLLLNQYRIKQNHINMSFNVQSSQIISMLNQITMIPISLLSFIKQRNSPEGWTLIHFLKQSYIK